MRKNKAMKAASLLLVLTLASSCFVGGTFAKYTSSAEGNDEARVAKWGVTLAASGSLYGEKYAADPDNKITASEAPNVVSVYGKQSTINNTVVAPGTESDKGFHFSINGKPEVDTKVSMELKHQNIFLAKGKYGVLVEAKNVTEENFVDNKYYKEDTNGYTLANAFTGDTLYELHDKAEVGDTGYWPVIYTMDGNTTYDAGTHDADSLKAIAETIAKKVMNVSDPDWATVRIQDATTLYTYSKESLFRMVENGIDLADTTDGLALGDIELSWAWAFEDQNNAADTILGNLMAKKFAPDDQKGTVVKLDENNSKYTSELVEGTDYCLDTKFSIGITVEQVN